MSTHAFFSPRHPRGLKKKNARAIDNDLTRFIFDRRDGQEEAGQGTLIPTFAHCAILRAHGCFTIMPKDNKSCRWALPLACWPAWMTMALGCFLGLEGLRMDCLGAALKSHDHQDDTVSPSSKLVAAITFDPSMSTLSCSSSSSPS